MVWGRLICDIISLMVYIGSHPTRIEVGGERDVFLGEVDCGGNEARLIDCSNTADSHCGRDEVAGVRCKGMFLRVFFHDFTIN